MSEPYPRPVGRTPWGCLPPLCERVAAKIQNDLVKRVRLLFCLFLFLLFNPGRFLHRATQADLRHRSLYALYNRMRVMRRQSARHRGRRTESVIYQLLIPAQESRGCRVAVDRHISPANQRHVPF